jgi:hypothetical protein
MDESKTNRRWYHPSPDRLIVGLIVLEILLLLSDQFRWFAFNEKKGYTVLIAVAAVGVVVVIMLLWLGASLLFRWRFQFTVRSLAVLVAAVAIPCCWLTVKMREAERQRKAVEAIRAVGGWVYYEYHLNESGATMTVQEPPAPAWLRRLLGEDFLWDVAGVVFNYPEKIDDAVLEHVTGLTRLQFLNLSGTQVTDIGLERLKGLVNIERLWLTHTQVTNAGLENLKGLTKLKRLVLYGTHVSEARINELRKALPNCDIDCD